MSVLYEYFLFPSSRDLNISGLMYSRVPADEYTLTVLTVNLHTLMSAIFNTESFVKSKFLNKINSIFSYPTLKITNEI